ncbi:MAG TPA: xylulokinase [Burkholderiales bacterium]|nr:xylulokinase [Burkholderiales bacterium]
MTRVFAGIDVGTSAVKALLADEDQHVVAEASEALPISRPRPLWSEQDPEDWWRVVGKAMARLKQAAPDSFASVRALGLSGQMHGAVLLDRERAVLRPAILWNDGRSYDECRVLEQKLPDLGRIAGVPAMPGFTAPKLLWLAKHEPHVFSRVRTVMLPKDYVRFRLSGEIATDMSDAAGTLWLDEATRAWSAPVLAATGLTMEQMPRLVEGSDPSGTLRPDLAREWGLPQDVVIAGGGGDAAAGAVGIGAVSDGDAFVSLGTSGQYFVSMDAYRPFPEAFIHAFCHAVPDHWYHMAAMLNGASCLAWAAKLVGAQSIDALLARVEANYRGAGQIVFLPYLTGERTPHNDPYARGVFFGLDVEASTEALIQSVLEGVAFSFAEAQDCLAMAGTRVDRVAAIGGGTRSPLWMRILASAIDKPVMLYREGAAGPAFGAARLARLAVTGESVREVCKAPPVTEVIEPEAPLVDAYRSAGEKYRRLYRTLREEFRR